MASSVETIQKILQETVAPGINDIKIELVCMKAGIKSLQSEIKRLDDKINTTNDRIVSLRNEMLPKIRRMGQKVDLSLEFRERLAAH
jgi:vacuolar-type H+-ATPase subunit D/Vma8